MFWTSSNFNLLCVALIKTEGGFLCPPPEGLWLSTLGNAHHVSYSICFPVQHSVNPMTLKAKFFSQTHGSAVWRVEWGVAAICTFKGVCNWKHTDFKSARSIFLSHKTRISLLLGLKIELKDVSFSTGDKPKNQRSISCVSSCFTLDQTCSFVLTYFIS